MVLCVLCGEKMSLHIPVLLGRHAGVALEVFPEERDVGEVQRVGYLLDSQFGGLQLGLRIFDDECRYDVGQGSSCSFLDGSAQVLGREVHFIGIKRDVPLGFVVFYHDTYQFFYDFLASGIGLSFFLYRFLLINISQFNNQPSQDKRELFFSYQCIVLVFCLYQHFEIVAEYFSCFRFEFYNRFFQDRRSILDSIRKQERMLDKRRRKSDKGEPAIGSVLCYLHELVGIDNGYGIFLQLVFIYMYCDVALPSDAKQEQASGYLGRDGEKLFNVAYYVNPCNEIRIRRNRS